MCCRHLSSPSGGCCFFTPCATTPEQLEPTSPVLGKLQKMPVASLPLLMVQGLPGGGTDHVAHRDRPRCAEVTQRHRPRKEQPLQCLKSCRCLPDLCPCPLPSPHWLLERRRWVSGARQPGCHTAAGSAGHGGDREGAGMSPQPTTLPGWPWLCSPESSMGIPVFLG